MSRWSASRPTFAVNECASDAYPRERHPTTTVISSPLRRAGAHEIEVRGRESRREVFEAEADVLGEGSTCWRRCPVERQLAAKEVVGRALRGAACHRREAPRGHDGDAFVDP